MGLTFDIGLSAWIIQDGNYEDFEQGQTRSFALEFYPEKPLLLIPLAQVGPRCRTGFCRRLAR